MPKKHHVPSRLWWLVLALLIMAVVGSFVVRQNYYSNLRPVGDSVQKYITIPSGSTMDQIAKQLKEAGLIRSDQAFKWYVSIHNYREKLQAGTYSFNSNSSTQTIAQSIVDGKVATDLVTILPGQRLDQIRQAFISSGFDKSAVDAALNVVQYKSSFPALADNPSGSSLEGFLYPDSYQKTADTDPKQIVTEALNEMQTHLTTEIRKGFANQGLTVYQGVILASIVEREVTSPSDRSQVAQVFLSRLKGGIALHSDATAIYGAVKDGVTPSLTYDSAYNTYYHKGLPPGPIGTVSDTSLKAVAQPADTDWLYFVSGDPDSSGVSKTYFSKTLEEHEANTAKYCHKLCEQ